jgi:CheY-like chemotaxis protein
MNKILCVNDNEINLLILQKQIKLSGIAREVLCLRDGQEALDYYSDLKETGDGTPPDIIFLDIHMPIIGGWEFLDHFTKGYQHCFPDTKVIVFSYSLDDSEKNKTELYPCVIDFLNVPLTVQYLHDLKAEMLLVK